jgi:16S rRNA (cytidine1402-2'-O)-methyltransferase
MAADDHGTLYVVASPIGNLEDITYRAVRVLKDCDIIACEDTRQTRKLLDRYGITTPLLSYHEHNEASRTQELLRRLASGEQVALISDAGTPLISDPGYRLVGASADAGIRVVPLPGCCAAIAALSVSGLPADAFRFEGFLPSRSVQRRKALEAIRRERVTVIFYEAPHRIRETLEDIEAVLGGRAVVVARELTKMHEDVRRGTAAEIAAAMDDAGAWRGEMTVLIGPGDDIAEAESGSVREAVEEAIRAGLDRMEALKEVARRRGISKREAYRLYEEGAD